MKHERHILHLVVEHLGLSRLSRGDQVLVEDLEDVLTDLGQLGLDLLTVLLDQLDLGAVALGLLLLLNRRDDSPRGTTSANDVLVGDGKQVSLLDGQVSVFGGDDLHVLDHLCSQSQRPFIERLPTSLHVHTLIALSLLGELGQVDGVFVTHFVGLGGLMVL